MPFTSLTSQIGTYQGRLRPQGAPPVAGDYSFVLGSDVPGVKALLNIGDYFQIDQVGDLTGVKYVRFTFRGRPPTLATVGAAWQLSIRVAGVTRCSASILPGRTRNRVDLAVNTSHLAGNQSLTFRLEVVAA